MEHRLPEFWNLFCIEVEQLLASFRRAYTNERGATVAAKRVGNCLHITYALLNSRQSERALDICLDSGACRVFSRIEGEEKSFMRFDSDIEGKPALVNAENTAITAEQASDSF